MRLANIDQRFYTSQFGRFLSADRSHLNVGLNNSGSWNKYSYVLGDPINGYDPTGLSCRLVDNGSGTFVLNCSEPGGGDGGGAGGGSSGHAPLDPSPLTTQQAWSFAKSLSSKVAHSGGSYTDCQALADFAQGASDTSSNSQQFIKDFGALVPGVTASRVGLNYWSTQAVFLNTGQASGYAEAYQNTVPDNPNTNGDQGHHFAAFLELGYQLGGNGTLASITSAVYEYAQAVFGNTTLNMGDVQLGITAAQIGAGLKTGALSTGDVSGIISGSICNH